MSKENNSALKICAPSRWTLQADENVTKHLGAPNHLCIALHKTQSYKDKLHYFVLNGSKTKTTQLVLILKGGKIDCTKLSTGSSTRWCRV